MRISKWFYTPLFVVVTLVCYSLGFRTSVNVSQTNLEKPISKGDLNDFVELCKQEVITCFISVDEEGRVEYSIRVKSPQYHYSTDSYDITSLDQMRGIIKTNKELRRLNLKEE